MKDEVMEEDLTVAVTQTVQDWMKKLLTGCSGDTITCHHCYNPNHFAKDCMLKGRNSEYVSTGAMGQWKKLQCQSAPQTTSE